MKAIISLIRNGVIFVGIVATACAAHKQSPLPEDFSKYGAHAEVVARNVPYVNGMEDHRDLMLDIYSNPHDGLQPVAVMIHGGAWFKGSKEMENYVFLSMALANNGYVVFNINHRLAPGAKIKAEVEDAMAAVIWVKEHAGKYGGDPDRFAVVGGSSGGHLASLIAWASDDPYFQPTNYEGALDSDVGVAALFYPVLDPDRTMREKGSILKPLGALVLFGSIGENYRQDISHLSPGNHLRSSSVPAIFLTGDKDSLNLYPQSVEFQERLSSLGVDSILYTAPGKDHSFTSQYWEPETTSAIRLMLEFFNKHLK